MAKHLPPMNSLRAFEAVARHLSFTRAAEELSVTPGAVSQQIRVLEDWLGRSLFTRTRRSVAMTDEAMSMLPQIQSGLELLFRATSREDVRRRSTSLTVSTTPSFASKWLLPRLASFTEQHPNIDLRILATTAMIDFGREDVDLAVRFGRGPYSNLRVVPLFNEGLTPLCAPALLRGKGKLRSPDDLKKHRLLHDISIPGENERNSWLRWLEFAGVTDVPHLRGARFSLADLAMQAAMDGAGVVLGRVELAERDVAAGRLVRPFDIVMPMQESYFLVMPKGRLLTSQARLFRIWLQTVSTRAASNRRRKNGRDA